MNLLVSSQSSEFNEELQLILELSDALRQGLVDGELPVTVMDTLNKTMGITVSVAKNDVTVVRGSLTVDVTGAPTNTTTTVIVWSGGTYVHKDNDYDTVVSVVSTNTLNVDLFIPSGKNSQNICCSLDHLAVHLVTQYHTVPFFDNQSCCILFEFIAYLLTVITRPT